LASLWITAPKSNIKIMDKAFLCITLSLSLIRGQLTAYSAPWSNIDTIPKPIT
jgi:hypothetical protein